MYRKFRNFYKIYRKRVNLDLSFINIFFSHKRFIFKKRFVAIKVQTIKNVRITRKVFDSPSTITLLARQPQQKYIMNFYKLTETLNKRLFFSKLKSKDIKDGYTKFQN